MSEQPSTPLSTTPQSAVIETIIENGAPPHPLMEFWTYFSASKGAMLGLAILIVLIVVMIGADFLSPHLPSEQYRDFLRTPPFWIEGGTSQFLLGTDDLGRDILSRIMHGAQVSMTVGTMVVFFAIITGIALGLVAGFFQGVIDTALMRMMDILLALPSLLMALVIVSILGPSLRNAAIAIVVVQLPHFVRLTRASVINERSKDYVTASIVSGARMPRLMFITVLPNCLAPLIVQGTLSISNAILDLAALGFLGLGAQPPTPEWGTMLANAMQFIQSDWWIVTFPGLAILITVVAFNLLGDGLRDALDPKLKR